MKKRVWIPIVFVVLLILIILSIIFAKPKEYSRNIFYMDTYINVRIWTNNKEQAKKALDGVERIYKEYHELTDKYNSYDGIENIYSINHSDSNGNIQINAKLYNLLQYGSNAYDKSSHLLDIRMGGVLDVWKKYRDSGDGIPSIQELKKANNLIDIEYLDNNTILNNHPNLDLGAIAKGYTTRIAGNYLRGIGITKYLINAGGNVLVGDYYKNDGNYKIGIQNPNKDENFLTVVKASNVSVVTSGGYERNYEYDGVTYNHIIDPKTLYPANYMKSVTVITWDSALADVLSTTLFLMPIEQGLYYIKGFDAEAIWCDNNDNIIKTEGFSKYE